MPASRCSTQMVYKDHLITCCNNDHPIPIVPDHMLRKWMQCSPVRSGGRRFTIDGWRWSHDLADNTRHRIPNLNKKKNDGHKWQPTLGVKRGIARQPSFSWKLSADTLLWSPGGGLFFFNVWSGSQFFCLCRRNGRRIWCRHVWFPLINHIGEYWQFAAEE